jgi:phosphate transport system protein
VHRDSDVGVSDGRATALTEQSLHHLDGTAPSFPSCEPRCGAVTDAAGGRSPGAPPPILVVMRGRFAGELEQLGVQLGAMCAVATAAMRDATRALLDSDLRLAEQVIGVEEQLHLLREECERHAMALLALQAPVARDLRLVITSIQAAEKIERMGDLACHVAATARRRHPDCAVPETLRAQFADLGRLAALAGDRVHQIICDPVGEHFAEQQRGDDQLDAVHRDVLTMLGRPDGGFTVRDAIDVALLARFFERFADQAVGVTRRLDYVVTGDTPRST